MNMRNGSAVTKIDTEIRPRIDAHACAHDAVVTASCRACVDACPRQAFALGEDALAFDTDACDGCGICSAVCPRSAIAIDKGSVARSRHDDAIGFAGCRQSGVVGSAGVMTCVHALGLRELGQLYASGLRRLVLPELPCSSCKPAATETIVRTTANLQRLLDDRSAPPLVLDVVPAKAWTRLRDDAITPSRRSLLAALLPVAREPSAATEPRPRALADALPPSAERGANRLSPFVPVVEAARCSGCDACVRLCPDGALRFDVDVAADGPAYVVDPPRCTGCRLCLDVCESGATRLDTWQRAPTTRVAFDAKQCRSCGNSFKLAKGRTEQGEFCRICEVARHNRNLFQVVA